MPAKLIIDNRVRVLASELTPGAVERLKTAFEHENHHRRALERMNVPTYGEPHTIVTWEACSPAGSGWCARKRNYKQPDLHLTFPRGALGRVRECLANEGVDWTIEDRRTLGKPLTGSLPEPSVELRGYQEEMVQAMLERQNCIVRGGTGCGKTEGGLAFLQRADVRGLVIVWSSALFEQWVRRIQKTFGVPKSAVGIIRGKVRKIGTVTVAMQQTLSRMAESGEIEQYADTFGAVLVDEVQKFAAPSLIDAIDSWRARWRIGISADERRKDQKEFLIYDLFGEVAYEITREELLKMGHIVNVEVRVIPTNFRADWYGVANEDEPDREVDFDRLLNEMRADEDRNALIVNAARDEVREEIVTIVMTRRREHCLLLEAALNGYGLRTGLMIGGDDFRPAFHKTQADIDAGKCLCAVGTIEAIGTGIDMPVAKAAVVGSPLMGNKQLANQVWGRFCRKVEGLGGGRLYLLWDQHVYPKHLANALAWFPKVLVWDGDDWVDGRNFQKAWRREQSGLGAA